MGKASKWLRSLLVGKTSPDDKKEKALTSLLPPLPTELPIAKEKKWWRFWRPTVAERSISMLVGDQPLEAESSQRRQAMTVVAATAAAAEAAFAAAQAAAAVMRLTAGSSHQKAEEVAATRIQSAFRGYLARKALCALRGLVKLQALVRGHLIRKQAAAARCYMQALITAQSHRIQMAENSPIILQRKSIHRRSPHHPRSRHSLASPIHVLVSDGVEKLRHNYMDRAAEDIKILEMDPGVSRGSTKSRNGYSHTHSETKQNWFSEYCGHAGTPSKVDQSTEFSPCNGAYSEHFAEFAFAKAQSSPHYLSSISVPDATHPYDHHFFPSYMANTESSRAKARSQSAPRQRTDAIGQQSGRRRLSVVEGRNTLGSAKMQPSSSHVDMMANGHQYPWSLKLHKPNMSLKARECTLLMNTNNSRSLVNRNKHD